MSFYSTNESASKSELAELFSFLRSLWGLVFGVSILFPGSSALFDVMPMARADSQVFTESNSRLLRAARSSPNSPV